VTALQARIESDMSRFGMHRAPSARSVVCCAFSAASLFYLGQRISLVLVRFFRR
jgi:hypothetical protein